MTKSLFTAFLLFITAILPAHVSAQLDFITALYKDVHSITFYGQSGNVNTGGVQGNSECLFLLDDVGCGAGMEVLIDLTSAEGGHLELGLGASYMRGFTYERGADLQLAVRSFPTFSAYYTRPVIGPFQVYGGASFGLTDLLNAQAYDESAREYSMGATTFETGGTGGVYVSLKSVGLFAEASYRSRRFASINYTISTGKDTIPLAFPRSLDLSGVYISAGVQFDLKPEPPRREFYVGVWSLARVDAQQLPALVGARRVNESLNSRTEIVSGLLTLDREMENDTSVYLLELHVRHSTVNAAGQTQTIDSTVVRTESGRYTLTDDNVLVLLPDRATGLNGQPIVVPSGARTAVRLDAEMRIQPVIAGVSGLVFSKTKATNRVPESQRASSQSRTP